jgi:hypothetical protein
VLDGSVPEIAIFSEQFAVVRGDRDVGILGYKIEEFLDYSIEIFDGPNLSLAQFFKLIVIEKLFFALD